MHIPDDPLYYEKVLLRARRSWIQGVRCRLWKIRDPRVLGPVVSRGRPPYGGAGC
jgi:hypothetical protein